MTENLDTKHAQCVFQSAQQSRANDPVGYAQGGVDYFNRYAYTFNDTVNAIDPDGRQPEELEDEEARKQKYDLS